MKWDYTNKNKTVIGLRTHNGAHDRKIFLQNRQSAKLAHMALAYMPKNKTRALHIRDAVKMLEELNLL